VGLIPEKFDAYYQQGNPGGLLVCGDGEFEAEEGLYSVRPRQAQAESTATVFQIQVKIEKGAAFGFGDGPIGKVGEGDDRGVELEFVAVGRFGDFVARGDQAIGEHLMCSALRGIEGLDVAIETGFAAHR